MTYEANLDDDVDTTPVRTDLVIVRVAADAMVRVVMTEIGQPDVGPHQIPPDLTVDEALRTIIRVVILANPQRPKPETLNDRTDRHTAMRCSGCVSRRDAFGSDKSLTEGRDASGIDFGSGD